MADMTTSPPVLSLLDAEHLAERTLAAIDRASLLGDISLDEAINDRERVASDLAGLRAHLEGDGEHVHRGADVCSDARRYSDGLRRTGRLYGVTDV